MLGSASNTESRYQIKGSSAKTVRHNNEYFSERKQLRAPLNAWNPIDGSGAGQRMYLEGQSFNNKIYRGNIVSIILI